MTDTATLLIVDQDAASARRLAREAQARGYAVRAAACVDEAIALIERVDLVLLDGTQLVEDDVERGRP